MFQTLRTINVHVIMTVTGSRQRVSQNSQDSATERDGSAALPTGAQGLEGKLPFSLHRQVRTALSLGSPLASADHVFSVQEAAVRDEPAERKLLVPFDP